MEQAQWFLGVAFALCFLGNMAERLLLKRIWVEDHLWADNQNLPAPAIAYFSFQKQLNFYLVMIRFDPHLRKDAMNFVLLALSWLGMLPAFLLAVIGGVQLWLMRNG